jgi:hypothetical protein
MGKQVKDHAGGGDPAELFGPPDAGIGDGGYKPGLFQDMNMHRHG